jgi:hypothetical protein
MFNLSNYNVNAAVSTAYALGATAVAATADYLGRSFAPAKAVALYTSLIASVDQIAKNIFAKNLLLNLSAGVVAGSALGFAASYALDNPLTAQVAAAISIVYLATRLTADYIAKNGFPFFRSQPDNQDQPAPVKDTKKEEEEVKPVDSST